MYRPILILANDRTMVGMQEDCTGSGNMAFPPGAGRSGPGKCHCRRGRRAKTKAEPRKRFGRRKFRQRLETQLKCELNLPRRASRGQEAELRGSQDGGIV